MGRTFPKDTGAAAARRRSGLIIKCIAAFLAVVLLAFVGIRLKGWQNQRRASRAVVLVNAWNYVDDTAYTPRLTEFGEGQRVDRSCVKALRQMLDDCAAAGGAPRIVSAYRSRAEQEQFFAQRVEELIAQGAAPEEAEEQAARSVARPGSSEHELGLAVDIADAGDPVLDERQAGTATHRWLRDNAWRYGFILRYPEGSTPLTGAPYEPWHYRYVGQAAAWQIYSLDITLEEYASLFYSEEAEIVFDEAE